ncbi:glycoside hydrolase family 2 protein [Pengzhenrongella phosphoraccumulans]|uniref:glycoside hydrolase family 2 protein n=1 Tax=Pengzhenrongella phosphoraccumulans TaxID=3114394 RepID=UPI00388F3B4F
MIVTNLCGPWTLRSAGGPVPADVAGRDIPAVVPGTAHTDLLAAGLIADPYVDQGEAELVWAHRADWQYTRELFAAPAAAGERLDLVFDGLDTVATVTLGGATVGRTFNQHRSYRLDVREQLDAAAGKPVTLGVHFRSALEYAESERERLGARPAAYEHPLNMVRKMACSFGWDWGPDLQTAGIWKPVSLERWSVARLSSVRPLVSIDTAGTALVAVHVAVERSGLEARESALTVRVRLGDVRATATIAAGATSAIVDVVVPHAALWWPVGYGEQPLHVLDVTLEHDTDEVAELGTWHRRIGLRTVELDTSPDEVGTAFTLRVNGQPVFVRGANWIPDDHLLTRITRDRLARRIDQAVGANLNLLRVWGGGIYESEDFYTLCDEAGVMVWQDFPLACAAYPEEEPLRGEFEAEAREHVTRLSAHPSLVVWNGGNENIWGWMDWGWQEKLAGKSWGWGYYTELFPSVIAELDPTRPYSVGSPCSPGAAPDVVHPNDPDHGTHHQWEVWNRTDYTTYRDEIPRFCSEFGFQAPPTWATLERAVRNPDGSPLSKHDPVFLIHQKAEDGNGKLDRGMAPHLGIPSDFADWHWAAQLNQARAVAHAITHYRSWWPRTSGAIVWQLNDCWPVTSWAAVDGDEHPKPLWWALRDAFADRILTVQVRDGHEVLAVVNDCAQPWIGTVHVRRELLDGTLLAEADLAVTAAARSVELLTLPANLRDADVPSNEVLVAELGGVRTVHTWVPDVDLGLAPSPLRTSVEVVDGGYQVTVAATSLALDVMLLVDRLDPAADVDLGLVTLPAGAAVTFRVRSAVPGLEGTLTGPAVLRSANDLAATRPAPTAPARETASDREVASIG